MNAMAPPDKYKIKGQKLGYDGSGSVLGDNIKHATGKSRPANFESHHICPINDPRGEEVRALLKANAIDINEAVNGVYLPKGSKYVDNGQANHRTLHTKRYYDALKEELEAYKGNPEAMRAALAEISHKLLNNSFPH